MTMSCNERFATPSWPMVLESPREVNGPSISIDAPSPTHHLSRPRGGRSDREPDHLAMLYRSQAPNATSTSTSTPPADWPTAAWRSTT